MGAAPEEIADNVIRGASEGWGIEFKAFNFAEYSPQVSALRRVL